MSWESFVFSLKHPEFPSGNDPIWRLRIFFEKMGGKKPTNLEESCFGGIHSLRNFGICRGKGAPWLKSPGKKEHVWGLVYPMWHKLGSAGGVVFFWGDGRVRVFWSVFHGGFRIHEMFQPCFSSFALVETCFVALESRLSNAHPHVPPLAWHIEASSGDTRSTFGLGGGWSRFVDSSLIGWFFLYLAWLVCWFYFCLGGVFSFCLVC